MVLANLPFFLERDSHRGEFEGFLHTILDKTRELFFISLPRLLLNLCYEPLHTIHFPLGRLLKPPTQSALQRLNENNQYKQENRSCRFRRNFRLEPAAQPAH